MSQSTVDEVLENFDALLGDVDFSRELQMLGITRLDFVRRRAMLMELRGLYMGLWALALRRSFPDTADDIFAAYLERHSQRHKGKKHDALRQRAQQYKGMLLDAGDQDFTGVSRHILSFRRRDEAELKSLTLRLALNFRATYSFLFERLL